MNCLVIQRGWFYSLHDESLAFRRQAHAAITLHPLSERHKRHARLSRHSNYTRFVPSSTSEPSATDILELKLLALDAAALHLHKQFPIRLLHATVRVDLNGVSTAVEGYLNSTYRLQLICVATGDHLVVRLELLISLCEKGLVIPGFSPATNESILSGFSCASEQEDGSRWTHLQINEDPNHHKAPRTYLLLEELGSIICSWKSIDDKFGASLLLFLVQLLLDYCNDSTCFH